MGLSWWAKSARTGFRSGTLKLMNQPMQLWTTMLAPVATLLGTMLVVMLGVYLQNRANERLGDKLGAQIEALRPD